MPISKNEMPPTKMWNTFIITRGRLNVALGCLLSSLSPWSLLSSAFSLLSYLLTWLSTSYSTLIFNFTSEKLVSLLLSSKFSLWINCQWKLLWWSLVQLTNPFTNAQNLQTKAGPQRRAMIEGSHVWSLKKYIIVHPQRIRDRPCPRGPPQLAKLRRPSGNFLFRNGRF